MRTDGEVFGGVEIPSVAFVSDTITTNNENTVTILSHERLPTPNNQIINYLHSQIQPILIQISDHEWKSTDIGAGDTCKKWVSMIVIPNAFADSTYHPIIPKNDLNTYSEWILDEGSDVLKYDQFKPTENEPDLVNKLIIFFKNALPGDIIQSEIKTGSGNMPHTFIVDSMTNQGLWVFDSNWSNDLDGTVRYHLFPYEKLASMGIEYTIYRVKDIQTQP